MSDAFTVTTRLTPFDSPGGSLATDPEPPLASQAIQVIPIETSLLAEGINQVIISHVLHGGSSQAPVLSSMRIISLNLKNLNLFETNEASAACHNQTAPDQPGQGQSL